MRYKSPVHGEGNVRIKGADRTSVSREAKTVNSSWLVSILLLSLSLSLSRSFVSYTSLFVRSLSDIRFFLSFMSGEVTDLLTIAGDERASGKRRGGKRRDEEDQTTDFVGTNRRHSILYTSLHRTFECPTLDLK